MIAVSVSFPGSFDWPSRMMVYECHILVEIKLCLIFFLLAALKLIDEFYDTFISGIFI